MTHQVRLERKYEDFRDDAIAVLRTSPRTQDPVVIAVVSMHPGKSGQWILADGQDPLIVAQRLRLCADILEAQP
jgi:hypothetical protein